MSYNNQIQDWTPVTIHGGGSASQQRPAVQRSAGAAALLRAENDQTPPRKRYLSTESVATIQEYRRVNSKTQRDLDQMCSFPSGTINSFEGRRATPTQAQLSELSRTLRLTLTLDK